MELLGPKAKVYKAKNPELQFFCPLCRTERSFIYSSNLSRKNYLQIGIISLVLVVISFPFFAAKSWILVPIVWAFFEAFKKTLFRREIPCPHCGFDMTWYKRDVKVSRKLVEEFWSKKKSTPQASAPTPGPGREANL